MAQAIITRGGGKDAIKALAKVMKDITYTGRMLSGIQRMADKPYVLLILETSGTLTMEADHIGDLCLIGGGGGGASGTTTAGGGGGGGGYVTNVASIPLVSGQIEIGSGGNTDQDGGHSTYVSYSGGGGKRGQVIDGGDGGSGGGGGDFGTMYGNGGTGQGTTTRPFGSLEMRPQAGGGGAGGQGLGVRTGDGGSDGGDGEAANYASANARIPGNGGAFGGSGGSYMAGGSNGSNGSGTLPVGAGGGLGYGGGGGGGRLWTAAMPAGGVGGNGAVMIRIPI